jgi:hypothetical protein
MRVRLLLLLEHVERRALRHKEQRGELELALDVKVLRRQLVLPVVGERLVERAVLLLGDLGRIARPDRLLLVEQLPLARHLLHLLRLLLLGVVVGRVLDLGLLVVLVGVLVGVVLVVRHDLLLLLRHPQRDRVLNELRVLLDDLLEALLLEKLELVLLEEQLDLAAAAELLAGRVVLDRELAARRRLPQILLILVVLGRHLDAVGDEVRAVEADAELADHAHVGVALAHHVHEVLGARARNRAEVVHEVGLGHADAGVDDLESLVLLVGADLNLQLLARVELRLVGQRLVANLVTRVRRVRDEFAQENLLVGVERVDNQRHQLIDLGLCETCTR